jgi:hypothetical protein
MAMCLLRILDGRATIAFRQSANFLKPTLAFGNNDVRMLLESTQR